MAITREELHHLIEGLPEQEMESAQRFLLFLSQEPIGPEFGMSIQRGLEQADSGQTIVCRDYEDMVERVLGN